MRAALLACGVLCLLVYPLVPLAMLVEVDLDAQPEKPPPAAMSYSTSTARQLLDEHREKSSGAVLRKTP